MTFSTIEELLEEMNISKFQKHQNFHILKFKDHLDEIPMKTDFRKCDFFQIVITKNHNVDVIVDNVSFSAMEDSITFMAPHQTLSTNVKSIENLGLGYMLVFSSNFLRLGISEFDLIQKFPFFNVNYSPVYFLKENTADFFHLMEKIYKLFQEFSSENLEIIRSYLTILLYEGRKSFFNGEIQNTVASRHNEVAFAFENQIKETVNKRKPIEHYANKLNISSVYLSECVKKATGKTAKQIITEYVILQASSMLLQSTKTIDEIAYNIGYSNTSNFGNFFKKHTGMTPSIYRKIHK
ncbi:MULTISPECIES: helix-turn-helix domain-containing protein [unclassified Tenacibaculum]|uniref:helix-turn-helix domain-containing protein n=1 Tax=unclassified Tenacibaculum TaxID=2635139 RepID=UPI001F2E9C5A|nr:MULTISPECIES: helix-turn-helix domain-containing protein [unclassified Tenacibaculum]MCF2875775.1 helix-turn-helix domain-containing protein [Tenacibaculum sp. Cn5-1]MCF2935851.1 helix-turn-helix domain-containing protein [Tenacibaculum sp. Cn5-34]MCG7512411.1 helix-turn-helix domain-containing protein [Tenacibaculum sp. Cn5-46]